MKTRKQATLYACVFAATALVSWYSLNGRSTVLAYQCPYEWAAVRAVEHHVVELDTASWVELLKTGERRIEGYARPLYTTLEGFAWQVVIANDLNSESFDAVYRHELCHIYEVEVLGKSLAESKTHKGWGSQ